MSSSTSTEPTADYDERTDGPPPGREDVPAEATTEDSGAPEDDQDGTDDSPGKEAARYRRKLRVVERERDTLTETITAMRRAEVERIAASQVMNPAALWAAGVELDSLLGEDGAPDEAKVRDAVTEAATRLGLARPVGANHVAREGSNPRASGNGGMVDAIMGR